MELTRFGGHRKCVYGGARMTRGNSTTLFKASGGLGARTEDRAEAALDVAAGMTLGYYLRWSVMSGGS